MMSNTYTTIPEPSESPPGKPLHVVITIIEEILQNVLFRVHGRSNSVDAKTIIEEILQYVLCLALCRSTPTIVLLPKKSQEVQTIWYDLKTDKEVADAETLTNLTCEPRHSDSKLLSEYEGTKSFVLDCLKDCFIKGVETRIIIDDLLDELVAEGANRLKYPMKNQIVQTVASYRSHKEKDEDVLQKLKMPLVIDPLEAAIIVGDLMDILLNSTRDEVSLRARYVTKNILRSLVQRTVRIGLKLAEIREQSQPKSIEQLLEQRRKKIELKPQKELETAATQTGLAGVPEIAKIKETKDVLCSVCTRQSICDWCVAAQEGVTLPKEDTKILRTQDILLAYKPCYVVGTASEKVKTSHLQPINLAKKKTVEKPIIGQLPILPVCTSSIMSNETRDDVSSETIDIFMTPKKDVQARDSISEWAEIVDATLAKSWSLKDSVSDATGVTTSSTAKSISRSCCRKSLQSESALSLQATKALQILKNTFCTRDICHELKGHYSPSLVKDVNKERMSCDLDNCMLLNLDQHSRCGRPINNIDRQVCARPRTDKFRDVLTRHSESRGHTK